MRKLILATLALVATLIATPASAQSLTDILGLVGGEQRSSNGFILPNGGYSSSNCYGTSTLAKAACRVDQVQRIRRDAEYRRQQDGYRHRQQFDQRARQIEALQRACKAGDVQSCRRSGGADERSMTIARALMDACQAGDRDSCRRSEAMLSSTRVEYNRYSRR